MHAQKRWLDLLLGLLFLASVGAIFVSHEDPFVRDVLCARASCPDWAHAKAWHKIIYDFAVASVITLIFYALVVRVPDYQRRRRIKRSLTKHYKAFREDCIEIMLLVADGTYNAALPEILLEQEKFRDYFKEPVAPDRNRWHEFQNNLSEHYLRELLTRMEIFRDEISFVLNNTDIPRDEPFEFLKRLSAAIYSMKDTTLGYDETKSFAGFLWNVFAGWDIISGYRKHDIIEKMIKAV